MAFDSAEYLILLALSFLAFHGTPGGLRIPLLLITSIIFYCSWSAPFVLLILVSAVVDFTAARRIDAASSPAARRLWLVLSLCTNLGILGFFKYAEFLRASFHALAPEIAPGSPWQIILPIGISFYTFQTMSYSVDVYRGKLRPCDRFLDFCLYVSFFPQLIAGPIERAGHLLPQLECCRNFRLDREHFHTGIWLITWGLFKKMVLADNLAMMADPVFADIGARDGGAIVVATWAFAFQIFFDFSAYSDIARGSASLFGIKLVRNFRLPYLAESPSEFWRRWHVSLSEWIRDYLYFSLGGARRGRARTLVNLALTMALAGLWHGAAWHFVAWGLFHGALLVLWRLLAGPAERCTSRVPELLLRPLRVALVFQLVCLGWLVFRVENLDDLRIALATLADWHVGMGPNLVEQAGLPFLAGVAALFFLMSLQERFDLITRMLRSPVAYGCGLALCLVGMALLAPEIRQEFIYFQF